MVFPSLDLRSCSSCPPHLDGVALPEYAVPTQMPASWDAAQREAAWVPLGGQALGCRCPCLEDHRFPDPWWPASEERASDGASNVARAAEIKRTSMKCMGW